MWLCLRTFFDSCNENFKVKVNHTNIFAFRFSGLSPLRNRFLYFFPFIYFVSFFSPSVRGQCKCTCECLCVGLTATYAAHAHCAVRVRTAGSAGPSSVALLCLPSVCQTITTTTAECPDSKKKTTQVATACSSLDRFQVQDCVGNFRHYANITLVFI